MPQRNGQNPIRMEKTFKQARNKFVQTNSGQIRTAGMMQCPACKADVPPKPGFRMQSLKCPKCGTAMHK
jgi:uncharacterized protein (UPF0212 family)